MQAVLIKDSCEIALQGKERRPQEMTDAQYEEKDKLAMANIYLALDDSVLFNIETETTAKGIWDKLKNLYEGKSLVNKIYLRRHLYNLKMKDGTSIQEHLSVFNSTISKLAALDVRIEDEEKATLLLCSMPESWDNLIMNLSHVETLRTESVVASLLTEEMRRKSSQGNSSGEAMIARGRPFERERGDRGKTRSKSKGKKKVKCWNCGKSGHVKKDCRVKRIDTKSESGDFQGNVAESEVGSATSEDGDALTAFERSELVRHWILDSGASFHMTPFREWFHTYKSWDGGVIYLGNNTTCSVVGVGDVRIKMFDGIVRTVSNVRHVPALRKSLLSLGKFCKQGLKFVGEKDQLKVSQGCMVVIKGEQMGGLYKLVGQTQIGEAAVASSKMVSPAIWHRRLGHMSERGLQVLTNQELLPGYESVPLEFCEDCIYGKQRRLSFSLSQQRSKEFLELIHSDTWESPDMSLGRCSYFVSFIDDYSRKAWIYILKRKSDVFETFKKFKALVENEKDLKIKCLRSDNGGEYCSKEFEKFCGEHGIRRHLTVPGTPQQNGVAERYNRTIMERVRSMLNSAKLDKRFWAEAASTACYLINRAPTKSLGLKIPEELWSGKTVNYSHLRVFGCDAYAWVPKEKRTKLDRNSHRCIFLGYAKGVKGYRLWDPTTHKITVSRDVIFNEESFQGTKEKQDDEATAPIEFFDVRDEVQADDEVVDNEPDAESSQSPEDVISSEEPSTESERPRRVIRPPARYDDYVTSFPSANHVCAYVALAEEDEPTSYREACESTNAGKWHYAMEEEMESLRKNNTWKLVVLPKGRNSIGCRWIYKVKKDTDGNVERFKARLVVKGYAQKPGIDFDEIFSPVVRLTTIRVVLAIAAVMDLELEQMDVKTAFLHGDLEQEIYISQPEGFIEKGKEELVCRLNKSLYGLKQAPRCWYKRFDSFIMSLGFDRLEADHCAYFYGHDDGSFCILLLYVDDMMITGNSKSRISNLKTQLAGEFEMKDLGAVNQILGMKVLRERKNRKVWLSQKGYVEKVLRRFNMQNAKPVSTPFPIHLKLSAKQSPSTEAEEVDMARVPYSSAVGSLMFAMVCTRPDIAQAVGVVSRYMANPGSDHWKAVKWILRYLRGTTDYSLCYGSADLQCIGYVDSDFAGDRDRRRSTTGYVFSCGGGAISWESKLQSVVAQSTTEAEYIAVAHACKEAIWLNRLLGNFKVKQDVLRVNCDSQSALHLAKNPAFHSRTKHIDIRYHFVRDVVDDGLISLLKVHTDVNPADVLTKPVTREKLNWSKASLGLGAT